MASLSPKDRVSLCLFSYEDGRRCRTPRISSHPHFCFYHAQKESQSQATEKLAKELTYFFSGDYLSANDLNTALGRLIPAVVRGEIKPRLARTVAYMLQTLTQSTRQAQHEYINAFGSDAWRDAISTSVKGNHKYLHPPKPKQPVQPPVPPAPPTPVGAGLVHTACPVYPEPIREERREPRSARPAPTAPPGHTSPPPTSPQQPVTAAPSTPPSARPSPADTEAALAAARAIFPARANTDQSEPSAPAANPSPTQAAQPNNTPPAAPPSQPRRQLGAPNRDPYAVHFDHTHRLLIDGKPW
jgi:hypothetical protein